MNVEPPTLPPRGQPPTELTRHRDAIERRGEFREWSIVVSNISIETSKHRTTIESSVVTTSISRPSLCARTCPDAVDATHVDPASVAPSAPLTARSVLTMIEVAMDPAERAALLPLNRSVGVDGSS